MVDPSEPTVAPPSLLKNGRYQVVGVLGEGSQGQTLDAVDIRAGRMVAIKRFQIRGARSWKDVELAEREAKVLRALRHQGLPEYVDHFEEQGCLYLAMTKMEGVNLRELGQRGALDQHEVVRFLNDISEILSYLHGRSPPVIHRDIKPSNVIRRPDGSYALVDFGSVRDSLKPDGGSTVVGTFGYMAPEQFQGRALPTSDLYAVGATALRLLSGSDPDELPHRGLSIDVTASLGGQVDPRVIWVLTQLLAPDPDQRAQRLFPLLQSQGLLLRGDVGAPRAATGAERDQVPDPRVPRNRRPHRARHRSTRHHFRGGTGPATLAPLLQTFVFLALNVASIATWALFNVMLPTLFGILSIVFGRSFRRTAGRMDDIGRQGRANLQRAAQYMASQAAAQRDWHRPSTTSAPPKPRVRVSETIGARVDEEAEDSKVPEAADHAHSTRSAKQRPS